MGKEEDILSSECNAAIKRCFKDIRTIIHLYILYCTFIKTLKGSSFCSLYIYKHTFIITIISISTRSLIVIIYLS